MLCAIDLCQDATLHGSTKMKPPFLPFNETNLCNDYILRNSEYIDRFCIDFPCHCVFNQVYLDTNLLDNVILTKVLLQPTEKPRSVGSHNSKSKKTTSKKKSPLKNKKFRSVSTQLCGGSTDPSSDEEKHTTTTSILHERKYEELFIHRYWCI